jgi:hypothetical protein
MERAASARHSASKTRVNALVASYRALQSAEARKRGGGRGMRVVQYSQVPDCAALHPGYLCFARYSAVGAVELLPRS